MHFIVVGLALVLLGFWCSRVALELFGRFWVQGARRLSLELVDRGAFQNERQIQIQIEVLIGIFLAIARLLLCFQYLGCSQVVWVWWEALQCQGLRLSLVVRNC